MLLLKNIIAVLVFIIFVVLAAYTGIWVMFIGGIVGLIEAIRSEVLNGLDVAISIAKILFAGLVGWLIFYFGTAISALISGQLFKKFKRKRR